MQNDKKLNETIRVQKRKNSFVMIDKGFLEDSHLSYKAKGLLAYLLSKPDNWKVIVKDLISHAKDGRDSIYAGLKELKECGYYSKAPIRNEKGIVTHWDSVIYETPEENPYFTPLYPLPAFPDTVKPDTVKPDTEKPERNNNYINNNYINNNQSSQSSQSSRSVKEDGQDTNNTRKFKNNTYTLIEMIEPCPSFEYTENKGTNNNIYKNKHIINNQSSHVMSNKKPDGQDPTDQTIQSYTELIKENISYPDFETTRPNDIELIDEFIAIILDVVMTESKTVRINDEDKPRELVKHNLLRLDHNDIDHAVDQFKGQNKRITKKKQYILTLLYNCKMELNLHYTNLVKHDMHQ